MHLKSGLIGGWPLVGGALQEEEYYSASEIWPDRGMAFGGRSLTRGGIL